MRVGGFERRVVYHVYCVHFACVSISFERVLFPRWHHMRVSLIVEFVCCSVPPIFVGKVVVLQCCSRITHLF